MLSSTLGALGFIGPGDWEVFSDAVFLYGRSMSDELLSRKRIVLLAVLFEGGLALAALGLGWLVNQPPLQSLHMDLNSLVFGAAATVPMLLFLLLAILWPVGPLLRARALLDEVVRPLFHGCSVIELALISFLAGLGEEMLFRGVLQGLFTRWLGSWGSVGAVNLLFGLLHFVTPTYALIAGLAGVYLSCCWLWRENLLVVVIPHALFDFVALLYVARGAGAR